jgi:hypothetical protein
LWATSGSAYMSSSASGSVVYALLKPPVDIVINITTMVQNWISGTFSNNGLVCKFPDIQESSSIDQGNLKFFSRNTHTIYIPQLITKWDDQIFITGSLTGSVVNPAVIPYNVQSQYKQLESSRIDFIVREKFPLKTFDTVFSRYAGVMYLPTSSFYSIIDDQTGTVVIPFDNYSKISTDTSGSFIIFNVQNMYPLRYYRLLVKTIINNQSQIHDNNIIFKVIT